MDYKISSAIKREKELSQIIDIFLICSVFDLPTRGQCHVGQPAGRNQNFMKRKNRKRRTCLLRLPVSLTEWSHPASGPRGLLYLI